MRVSTCALEGQDHGFWWWPLESTLVSWWLMVSEDKRWLGAVQSCWSPNLGHDSPVVLGEQWGHVYREIWVHLLWSLSRAGKKESVELRAGGCSDYAAGRVTSHPWNMPSPWEMRNSLMRLVVPQLPRNPSASGCNLRGSPRALSVGEPTRAGNILQEEQGKVK